ncbi:hypothetical protein [Streptomyces sp. NPDC050535]|uniref:hypothetical protein n=1 Tax=Streptomyces sp. NPDC050535 TaxID=3365626 RepID=UPI0037B28E47
MTVFLAGMRATADRMNDNSASSTTTSGLVAATGFSITSFSGTKVNGITFVNCVIQRTGAAIAELATNSGDITDILCATLPAGWRPSETTTVLWGTTVNDGRASVSTTGDITLITTSGSGGIGTNATMRISFMWISQNG